MSPRSSRVSSARAVATLVAVAASTLAAPAVADAPPHHAAFALIVTNNRGGGLARPDLQYADDDGARYYRLFQTLAPADHLRLLTELDRDTARLFPDLHPAAPSRANVTAAAAKLALEVATAVRAGDAVDFYFIFAGHGDVDHGRGFLELTDGAFDGDDLERLLAAVGATRAHVILDSCNSFFVMTPRKPGGRRIATPSDAAAGLASRLPNVGVFVSTSAEAEVFEWSELQSGVFSHAVRSGLAGAADADADGVISYAELRAFVDTATSEIRNAAYRPKVFARGPAGDDTAPLFTATTGTRLLVPPAQASRLTVRDRDELPWIDANKEPGASLVLRLPPGLEAGAIDEQVSGDAAPGRVRRTALPAPMPGTIALAELPGREGPPASRGSDDLFRRLFALPFGPHALARYEVERAAAPPPVFGISHEDAERMQQLLGQVDAEERETRKINGGVTAGVGAYFVASAAYDHDLFGALTGAAVVALGAQRFWSHPASEHLRRDFADALAAGGDPSAAVAATDRRLRVVAAEARHARHVALGLSIADLAIASTLYVVDRADNRALGRGDASFDTMVGVAAAVGALGLATSIGETPIERTARTWNDNLDLGSIPHVGLAPVRGGAAISLGGSF